MDLRARSQGELPRNNEYQRRRDVKTGTGAKHERKETRPTRRPRYPPRLYIHPLGNVLEVEMVPFLTQKISNGSRTVYPSGAYNVF